jgi:hypothetical protein
MFERDMKEDAASRLQVGFGSGEGLQNWVSFSLPHLPQ